jgi:hypothetical protein
VGSISEIQPLITEEVLIALMEHLMTRPALVPDAVSPGPR